MNKPVQKSAGAGSSWDDDLKSSICLLIQGQYGAGKTTLAATISKYAPDPWPTVKHKGGPPKHVLKDCYWLSYDKGALLSFKERGVAVDRFDVRKHMAEKKSSVLTATEAGLREVEKAVAAGAEWVIVDTLSTYDKMLDAYWQAIMLADKGVKEANLDKSPNKLIEEIQIPKYGRMFVCHKMLHDNLMRLGCGVIYLTHSKALIDLGIGGGDEKEKQKKARQVVTTAIGSSQSGSLLAPDITGKGAGVYKADARLGLVVKLVQGVGGKLTREVWADPKDGYETKNSFELSIVGKQDANLRKILAKI